MNLSATHIAHLTSSSTVDVERFSPPLISAMTHYDISTPRRLAGFLGQVAHESGHFRHTEELMGYSAKRLMQVWPTRFPSLDSAKPFEYNPQALANRVYSGRMGNGDETTGDGWRYRGRGLIQLTGKAMYVKAEQALGMSITGDNSFRVAMPDGACWTACWYWYEHNCNYFADSWDLEGMTRAINGGVVGLDERIELCEYALKEARELGSVLFGD